MARESFEFETNVVALSFGKYDYAVVYLPTALQDQVAFPSGKPLRIEAEVNGLAHDGALMPSGGRRYLLLSKKLLKRLRCGLGDRVFVRFAIADQEAVSVPAELDRALDASSKARRAWDALTPGKQRGLAYRVASAKRADTRERKVEEVLAELLG